MDLDDTHGFAYFWFSSKDDVCATSDRTLPRGAAVGAFEESGRRYTRILLFGCFASAWLFRDCEEHVSLFPLLASL